MIYICVYISGLVYIFFTFSGRERYGQNERTLKKKTIFSGLLKMSYNPDKDTRFFRGNCSKKSVTKIPGIWKKNGKKLNNEGCETVWTSLNLLFIFVCYKSLFPLRAVLYFAFGVCVCV